MSKHYTLARIYSVRWSEPCLMRHPGVCVVSVARRTSIWCYAWMHVWFFNLTFYGMKGNKSCFVVVSLPSCFLKLFRSSICSKVSILRVYFSTHTGYNYKTVYKKTFRSFFINIINNVWFHYWVKQYNVLNQLQILPFHAWTNSIFEKVSRFQYNEYVAFFYTSNCVAITLKY